MKFETEIEDALKYALGYEFDANSFRQFTKEQKKLLRDKFTDNIITHSRVFFSNEFLLFTDESVYDDWCYYAGLEYVNSPSAKIECRGAFIVLFRWSDDDRIEDILNLLAPEEEEVA